MQEEPKLNFYNKSKQKNNKFYIRLLIYAFTLIVIVFFIFKNKKPSTDKPLEDLAKMKVKAEIYGNGSFYNNYYYGVRLSRPSADWDIVKVKDVYENTIESKNFEDRIKPLVRFVAMNKEETVASVTLNTIILSEPRISTSLAEENFQNLIDKYGEKNVTVLQKPTSHARGKLKAAYYVVNIEDPENPMTFIDVFVVKNKHAFKLHGETSQIRYNIYQYDFEHYINTFVVYR